MKISRLIYGLLFPCMLMLTIIGCLTRGSAPTQTDKPQVTASEAPARAESRRIAVFTLETPKAIYQLSEAIPLTIILKSGEFDLLLSQASLTPERMATHLIIVSADGTPLELSKTIPEPRAKMLEKDGQSVQGQPGIELKAGSEMSISIDNLLDYYPLTQPGAYKVELDMRLPIYRDSVTEKPESIRELEEEIKAFQNAPSLPENKKQQAIAVLKEEIQQLEAQGKQSQMFVVLSSMRGSAELQSNTITVTVK